ncbi:hypothetical protein [Roseobacter litoralis]|uniref:hypothetical protein n=1 Tax=Roseobacter litoralis TaxID=42443 RepID=UPI002494E709|nr:hypothetical protein [Roseobacter litoralis]
MRLVPMGDNHTRQSVIVTEKYRNRFGKTIRRGRALTLGNDLRHQGFYHCCIMRAWQTVVEHIPVDRNDAGACRIGAGSFDNTRYNFADRVGIAEFDCTAQLCGHQTRDFGSPFAQRFFGQLCLASRFIHGDGGNHPQNA